MKKSLLKKMVLVLTVVLAVLDVPTISFASEFELDEYGGWSINSANLYTYDRITRLELVTRCQSKMDGKRITFTCSDGANDYSYTFKDGIISDVVGNIYDESDNMSSGLIVNKIDTTRDFKDLCVNVIYLVSKEEETNWTISITTENLTEIILAKTESLEDMSLIKDNEKLERVSAILGEAYTKDSSYSSTNTENILSPENNILVGSKVKPDEETNSTFRFPSEVLIFALAIIAALVAYNKISNSKAKKKRLENDRIKRLKEKNAKYRELKKQEAEILTRRMKAYNETLRCDKKPDLRCDPTFVGISAEEVCGSSTEIKRRMATPKFIEGGWNE